MSSITRHPIWLVMQMSSYALRQLMGSLSSPSQRAPQIRSSKVEVTTEPPYLLMICMVVYLPESLNLHPRAA
jgi:hypothetical protein